MEYFSEICNQDMDEDSLFDANNCFLRQPKLPTHHPTTHSLANLALNPKKKVEVY
jgi:hypothetical protein